MDVLGIIVIVVGVALTFAGRLTGRSLPPDYDEESDDGFKELLFGVGKVITMIGIVFIIGGIICIVI